MSYAKQTNNNGYNYELFEDRSKHHHHHHHLVGYTTTRIAQATLAKCGNLEISRALETCVLMQPVSKYFNSQIKSKNKFLPLSEREKYYSTQTNGFYYAAQKNDICFNPPTMNTDYLDDVGVKHSINGLLLGTLSFISYYHCLGWSVWRILYFCYLYK
jgi:hypothetical protein